MSANRFTLTSQLEEINLAAQLYRTKSSAVPNYRLERLESVGNTLMWFQKHEGDIKAFMELTVEQRRRALVAGQAAQK